MRYRRSSALNTGYSLVLPNIASETTPMSFKKKFSNVNAQIRMEIVRIASRHDTSKSCLESRTGESQESVMSNWCDRGYDATVLRGFFVC